jgi:phosphoheptose isomerase
MRKVAVVSEHASPLSVIGGVDAGGQNVYVGQLAKHLVSAGYEVDIFTRRDAGNLPETADWLEGVRIVHVPAGPPVYVPKEDMLPLMAEFTEYVLDYCRREPRPYDIIHANFWMSGLVAAEVKKALGIPFVITFHALGRVRRLHQPETDRFPDERFAIEDRIVAEADRIIAECPQDEEDLIRLYEADPSRIAVIPCGFDPSETSPISKELARVALDLPPKQPVILQLGRMVPRKGVDNAIRGFAILRREYGVGARLVIVGGDVDDPDERVAAEAQRLRAIVTAEGIEEHVTFAGRRGREMLRYFYSAADIFVTTPWYEPFGITPVESMACATPVVGSNVGGIKFTVRDGETGYLVQPNNPEALAERIAYLYQNPTMMKVFSQQALDRARNLFTWSQVTSHMANLYETVLAAYDPRTAAEADELATVDVRFDSLRRAVEESQPRLRLAILEAARAINACFVKGGKLLICGNGGSAADAQHFAAEFLGRFRASNRPGLPAIALCADSAITTAWSNDVGYDDAFRRQVEALGRPGDVLVGISTSGMSANVNSALKAARRAGLQTIALSGRNGGDMCKHADVSLVVPCDDTQHIQEIHIAVIHMLCELVENRCVARRQAATAPDLSANGNKKSHRALKATVGLEETAGRARA